MNIGFDLDGVLYRWHQATYSYLEQQGRKLPEYAEFWKNADTLLSKEELDFILDIPLLYDKMFPEAGVVEYLQSLSDRGNTLYYITSRHQSVEVTTQLYLERYKYPQSINTIFSGEKEKYARLFELDIFVEDQCKYAYKLKDICKVILRRQPWNEHCEGEFDFIDTIPELEKYL